MGGPSRGESGHARERGMCECVCVGGGGGLGAGSQCSINQKE